MTRLVVRLVIVAAALLAWPSDARAQFETPNRAFHNATAFPLQGKHQTVACESCHLRGMYKGTPATCYDCHWARRRDDKFQTRLGTQCETCHRPTAWSAVRWDHAATTGLPLNGSHTTIGCESCHRGGDFRATAVACATCHQKDYQATQSPNHAAAGFPLQCETCHRPADLSFTQARFDHNASFPLEGPHATTACVSCHRNSVYQGTARDCVACHRPDYERAQNPNHAAAGFPTACESCHRPSSPTWQAPGSTGFNHNAFYSLVGRHAALDCVSCHRNNVFRGTTRDCVGCHQGEYDRTTSPSHVPAGFSTSCETCHRPTDPSWRGGTGFSHNAVFPLQGVHASQACATCHVNNVFRGTARDCVGCHRANYDRTTSPPHVAAGFPTSCETCHRATDTTWRGPTFNHAAVFPLQGAHASQACASCHRNNVYRGTARDCVGCHRSKYDATRSPNHVAAGFPTTCESCHRATDTNWTQGRFSHRFPLNGPHNVSCAQCHTTANTFAAFNCLACHSRSKTDEQHKGRNGYRYDSLACYSCHPNGKS